MHVNWYVSPKGITFVQYPQYFRNGEALSRTLAQAVLGTVTGDKQEALEFRL